VFGPELEPVRFFPTGSGWPVQVRSLTGKKSRLIRTGVTKRMTQFLFHFFFSCLGFTKLVFLLKETSLNDLQNYERCTHSKRETKKYILLNHTSFDRARRADQEYHLFIFFDQVLGEKSSKYK